MSVARRHGYADLVVAGLGIALGLAALVLLPSQIPGESLAAIGDMRSPAFFPILAALLSIGAGVLLMPAALHGSAEAAPAPDYPKRAWMLAALLLVAALVTPVLGGLVVLFLLVIGTAWIAGERRWPRLLLLAVVIVLAVHLLFERTLKVMMPTGIWGT